MREYLQHTLLRMRGSGMAFASRTNVVFVKLGPKPKKDRLTYGPRAPFFGNGLQVNE
jgi:hypothetical protein